MDLHKKRIEKELKEQTQRDIEWKKEHLHFKDNVQAASAEESEVPDPNEDKNQTVVMCTRCGHKNVLVTRSGSPASGATSPSGSRPGSGGGRVLMPAVIEMEGTTKPFGKYRWTEAVANMTKEEKHGGATSELESRKDLPKIKQYYLPAFEEPKPSSNLKSSSALSKSVGELRARSRPEC